MYCISSLLLNNKDFFTFSDKARLWCFAFAISSVMVNFIFFVKLIISFSLVILQNLPTKLGSCSFQGNFLWLSFQVNRTFIDLAIKAKHVLR